MKTLALKNGDLVVGPAGHATISGTKKIRQDLALALGEPYSDDRFHPEWGSLLPNYIGEQVGPELQSLVISEAARVIQAYVDGQAAEIQKDALSSSMSRYDTTDVVKQVNGVDATLGVDTIYVKVSLTTQANQTVTLSRTVAV